MRANRPASLLAGTLLITGLGATACGASPAIAAFRAHQPVSTTGLLSSIASLFTDALFSPVNTNFTRSDDAIVPASVASHLAAATRVLVTCGTADTNVPCGTLPALLDGSRQARTAGPGRLTLSGVDHLLHPAGTAANDQILAPSAVAALRSFLAPY
jgi:hypothetical protein